jgi:hypothetical protein
MVLKLLLFVDILNLSTSRLSLLNFQFFVVIFLFFIEANLVYWFNKEKTLFPQALSGQTWRRFASSPPLSLVSPFTRFMFDFSSEVGAKSLWTRSSSCTREKMKGSAMPTSGGTIMVRTE